MQSPVTLHPFDEPSKPSLCKVDIDRLICQYSPLVRAIVRRRLFRILHSKLDIEDVIQEFWRTLLRNPSAHLATPATEEDVRRMLVTILNRQIHKQSNKYLHTQSRNIDLEVSNDSSTVPSSAMTPSRQYMLKEAYNLLSTSLNAHERLVLTLRSQGYSHEAIATATGTTERHIRRLINQLQARLESYLY